MVEFVVASHWLAYGLMAQEGAPSGNPLELPLPLLIMMMLGLFYFMILRPQQTKDKDFRTMLEGLKEKDRVVTIGGIHGVVTNVQRDRDEVTVRVDEATGAKIRVGTSAIARLVTEDDKGDKKGESEKGDKKK